MTFKIVSYTGTEWSASEGCVTNVTEIKTDRTVIHDLPGADYDVIQSMGLKNRKFRIEGVIFYNVESSAQYFRDLIGHTGSISGSDDRGYTTLPQTQVFYTGVSFEDRGGRPFVKRFILDAVEVI